MGGSNTKHVARAGSGRPIATREQELGQPAIQLRRQFREVLAKRRVSS